MENEEKTGGNIEEIAKYMISQCVKTDEDGMSKIIYTVNEVYKIEGTNNYNSKELFRTTTEGKSIDILRFLINPIRYLYNEDGRLLKK